MFELLCLQGGSQRLPFECTGKGKHDANEMKRLLMPHMLDDDDITIEVMVIHYKKDGTNQRGEKGRLHNPCDVYMWI